MFVGFCGFFNISENPPPPFLKKQTFFSLYSHLTDWTDEREEDRGVGGWREIERGGERWWGWGWRERRGLGDGEGGG